MQLAVSFEMNQGGAVQWEPDREVESDGGRGHGRRCTERMQKSRTRGHMAFFFGSLFTKAGDKDILSASWERGSQGPGVCMRA